MRRFRHFRKPLGIYLLLAGIMIILAIILPAACWWFFLGIALVLLGILICRR